MTSPIPNTYNDLVALIQSYMERNDLALVSNIPTFVSNAQTRIATELKTIINKVFYNSAMTAGTNTIPKPTGFRNLIIFEYATSNGVFTQLRSLDYGVCSMYWPDINLNDVTTPPKFVTDIDANTWAVFPTPALNYPVRAQLYSTPIPLTVSVQTNAVTELAFNLLLYASLLEVIPFEKQDERQIYNQLYTQSLQQYVAEDRMRITTGITTRSIN
jgi:hypothetical protein